MADTYDVLIAGGGTAGMLLGARLKHARPDMAIKILEKEEAPGGRMRACLPNKGLWSYGLNFINDDLYQFIDQTLKLDPEAADLASYQSVKQSAVDLLSGSKLSSIKLEDFFRIKGVRALGGLAAGRDWVHMDEVRDALASGKRKDQAFHSIWPGTKKSPAVIVLEQMMQVLGIPELWSVSAAYLLAKVEEFVAGRHLGNWEDALAALGARFNTDQHSLQTSCQIVGANFDETEKVWTVSARGGQYRAKVLVSAQSPWETLQWLPKTYWPTGLLQMALKSKPVSCVVLSEVLDNPEDPSVKELASVGLIPAENAHVVVNPNGDICYQTTIDFEVSLQAPDVVKAVKRLKRARKKLQAAVPALTGKGEHLALVSAAWTQATAFSDRRLGDKTEDRHINTDHLQFIGDTYGRHYLGDNNLIRSVLQSFSRLSGEKVHVEEIVEDVVVEESEQGTDERTDY